MRFVVAMVLLLLVAAGGCAGAAPGASPPPARSSDTTASTSGSVAHQTPRSSAIAASTGSPTAPSLLPLPQDNTAPATGPALRPFTRQPADYSLHALARARLAHTRKRAIVARLFADAGVAFPPALLLLRGYKQERRLEVWAASEADGEMVHVTSYGVCAASGVLGPKRREGDFQVPEGFYKIQYLWPNSDYYLSMKVGYPNLSDRILGDRRMPGSDIMIHGSCASIGCLAMSDERIQELWVMGSAVHGSAGIHVHLFPTRNPASLRKLPQFEQHRAFWDNLYQGHALFEQQRRLPRVKVEWDGRYSFAPAS